MPGRPVEKLWAGKRGRFSWSLGSRIFILCLPSWPRLRPSSLEATGSLASSKGSPPASPKSWPWGEVGGEICALWLKTSLLPVRGFSLLTAFKLALRLELLLVSVSLSVEFRKRTLSLLCCRLLTSPLVALRLGLAPSFLSGLSVHQEDLPAPSFCTLRNRWCSDRLCRIEFFQPAALDESARWAK